MGLSRQEYWSGVPSPSPLKQTRGSYCHTVGERGFWTDVSAAHLFCSLVPLRLLDFHLGSLSCSSHHLWGSEGVIADCSTKLQDGQSLPTQARGPHGLSDVEKAPGILTRSAKVRPILLVFSKINNRGTTGKQPAP